MFSKGLSARLVQSICFSFTIILGYESIKRVSVLHEYKDHVRWWCGSNNFLLFYILENYLFNNLKQIANDLCYIIEEITFVLLIVSLIIIIEVFHVHV